MRPEYIIFVNFSPHFSKEFWRLAGIVSNEFTELNPCSKKYHFSKTHLTEGFILAFRYLQKWIQLVIEKSKLGQIHGGVRHEPCHISTLRGSYPKSKVSRTYKRFRSFQKSQRYRSYDPPSVQKSTTNLPETFQN